MFYVDSTTGNIFAARPFETEKEFNLIVLAEDNGYPKQFTSSRIEVIVNQAVSSSYYSPIFKSKNIEVDVTESESPGFLVALLQSVDKDSDQLWYDIFGKLHFSLEIF